MKNLLFLFTLTLFLSCEETDGTPECPDNASCLALDTLTTADLPILKERIVQLAADSECADDSECLFTGFGSKPCGGPWEYLIFSTASDTAELMTLVRKFNMLSQEYNAESGKPSDCAIAPAPDSVKCEGTGCIGYRNGLAYTEGLCCY
jgi:hypothetical protein